MLFLLLAPCAAHAEVGHRARLTETSITEVGRVTAARYVPVKTKGYGLGYVAPCGLGVAFTSLGTRGAKDGTDIELTHRYLDASYTATFLSDVALLTAGGGLGVSGDGAIDATSAENFSGKSVFVGPGFAIGAFEVYWIHRRNWASYTFDSDRHTLASHHYNLGLGWRF